MKLYTEEQVRKAIAIGYDWCHVKYIPSDDMIDSFIESLNPIKLPSDEEIVKFALQETNNINEQIIFNNGAIYVCKLIEEQILNQNK